MRKFTLAFFPCLYFFLSFFSHSLLHNMITTYVFWFLFSLSPITFITCLPLSLCFLPNFHFFILTLPFFNSLCLFSVTLFFLLCRPSVRSSFLPPILPTILATFVYLLFYFFLPCSLFLILLLLPRFVLSFFCIVETSDHANNILKRAIKKVAHIVSPYSVHISYTACPFAKHNNGFQ